LWLEGTGDFYVNGRNNQVTKSADLALASSSTWKTTQSGTGEDCDADVVCTSEDIATGTPDDPQPQAYVVGLSKTTLQLGIESIGYDFVANNTQGNLACPTQVTGNGQENFVAPLNDHMGSQITLYFTASFDIADSALQALPVGGTLHQAVQIDHKPVSDCETSVWTYCRDTLTWKGVVIVGRKA
jgi:hypothetical protein